MIGKTRNHLLISLIIFLASSGCGDKTRLSDEVVARVGDKIITVDDLLRRAELTPRTVVRSINGLTGNRALLEALIGEKLLAIEAGKLGLDQDNELKQKIKFIESQAVQRELYQNEILSQVEVKEEEILKAFDRLHKTLVVQYYTSGKRDRAMEFRKVLEKTGSFSDALQRFSSVSSPEEQHTARITWGQANEELEDIVFGLGLNETSPVFRSEDRYWVMRVINIIANPIQTEGRLFQKRSAIEKKIRIRKADRQSSTFVQEFMAKNQVSIEGKSFALLAGEITKRLYDGSDPAGPAELHALESTYGDLSQSESIRGNWDEPVVKSLNGNMTVGETVQLLQNYPLPKHGDSIVDLKAKINNHLLRLIRDQQMALAGYRMGLQNSRAVQDEVKVWNDYFLYSRMVSKLALRPQDSEDIVFSNKLHELRSKTKITVDSGKVESIKLTSIELIAVRPGQWNQLVTPPWPFIL